MANANLQLGNELGVVDATQTANYGTTAVGAVNTKLTGDDDLTTLADMRAALQVIDATTYSDTELNHMTMNDLVYALIVHDVPTSLGQNH